MKRKHVTADIVDIPVPQEGMELNDSLFFLQAELSSLNIWPEIVSPSKPAALSTSLKT